MGATAAVAVAVVGAGVAHEQQKKAAAQEKKGRKTARAGQAAVEAQNIRQQIREERVKRAQIIAAAETSGVAGASSEAGSLSAMRSTVGSNIAFSKGQTEVADQVSRRLQKASDLNRRADTVSAFSGVAAQGILELDDRGAFD